MLAGGLMGFVCVYNGHGESFEVSITDSTSYSESVTGNDVVASFIGGICNTKDEITYGIVTMSNNKTIELSGLEKIGGVYKAGVGLIPITYDKTEWENNIEYVEPPTPQKTGITLQVGIYADDSSQISFETSIDLGTLTFDVSTEESARQGLTDVDTKIAIISAKQTELGAIQNRLESAIDSIETNYENLVSSRSTLRDTDVAKESSEYIKQQILQQASATLLSTANQSPSIALQLI